MKFIIKNQIWEKVLINKKPNTHQNVLGFIYKLKIYQFYSKIREIFF
jgi:hypothetical protein